MKRFVLPILLASLKERTYVTVLYKLLRYNLLEATLTAAPMGISLYTILSILSANGYITKGQCLTIGKTLIFCTT